MTDDADNTGEAADGTDDDTVPTVDLSVYQLSVSVSGRSGDDLSDVEATARRLMDYLVDRAEQLEEDPDGRGLG